MRRSLRWQKSYVKALGSVGVTSICPTVDNEDGAFKHVVNVIGQDPEGAKILDIHSEGPYLNRVGEKGVDTGHPEIDLEHIQLMILCKASFLTRMMISDNVHLGGLKPGRYHNGVFGGECVITEEGFSLTDTGRLAESARPVLFGMKNLVKNMHIPLEKVCVMASLNPCEVYGFADRKGSLRTGKDADFAVLDDDFNCLYTYREGKKIYDHTSDADLCNADAYKDRIE